MNKREIIDVLIPVVEKDLDVLPYVIDAARKNVRHPIGEIFIVAPESSKIQNLSIEKNCKFIDENTILPITKKDIDYCPKKRNSYVDRSGWLFQQLLKLSGDTLSSREGYLVLDADTVLIRPHIFEQNNKTVFFLRSLYYRPYFETYLKLLGENAIGPSRSTFFISHYMFFKKKRVAELKKLIETRHQTDWYSAILDSMNKKKWDSFSEYETYGNFMLKNYPEQIILKSRRNLGLKRSSIKNISRINIKELANKHGIRSMSFHSWNT